MSGPKKLPPLDKLAREGEWEMLVQRTVFCHLCEERDGTFVASVLHTGSPICERCYEVYLVAEDLSEEEENAAAGPTVEAVSLCGCTNDALEAGRTCGSPECPNRRK